MKICKICKKVLNEVEFNKNNKSKDGLQCYCRDCQAEARQDRAWKKKCEKNKRRYTIADALLELALEGGIQ